MPRSSTPPRRDQSVISRVVEQVRDTTGTAGSPARDTGGSMGGSASNLMPSHRDSDVSGGGMGDDNDEF
jgi:hypothetical protein